MQRNRESIVEIVLIVIGLAVLISPTGRVARTGFEFGEYKYVVGFGLISLGCWLLFRGAGEK